MIFLVSMSFFHFAFSAFLANLWRGILTISTCVYYWTYCFGLLGFGFFSLGQTKSELEKKKEQLRKDIEITNRILEETRKNKSVSLNQLVALNKKIGMRQELISTITRESLILQYQIDQTNGSIATLEFLIQVSGTT